MNITPGQYPVGPANGQIILRTYRTGVAQSAGHDLVIAVTSWTGIVVAAGDPAASTAEITVDLGSLTVVSGSGGVKPLSDKDKADIAKESAKHLGAAKNPQAGYVATGVAGDTLNGTFTLGGQSTPVALALTDAGAGKVTATGSVAQTALGLKPFSAFLGALKLKDEIDLEITVTLA